MSDYDVKAIDAVVNIFNAEALSHRPDWKDGFFSGKIGADSQTVQGVELDEMLRRMDAAGIERGFLIATKCGPLGHPSCYHLPPEVVNKAITQYPDRFFGLHGVDPTMGMKAVYELQEAVEKFGYVGAHGYPHWFGSPWMRPAGTQSTQSAASLMCQFSIRSANPSSMRRTIRAAPLVSQSRWTASPAIFPN